MEVQVEVPDTEHVSEPRGVKQEREPNYETTVTES